MMADIHGSPDHWTAFVQGKRGRTFCCKDDHLTREAAEQHGAEKARGRGFIVFRLGSRRKVT
jgi:hypothetical protein